MHVFSSYNVVILLGVLNINQLKVSGRPLAILLIKYQKGTP
jgi:hypothetical protein